MMVIFIIASILSWLSVYGKSSPCAPIDEAFKRSMDDANEMAACQCFLEAAKPSKFINKNNSETIWLGCTRQKMPHVFKALNALNETVVSKLWIWDSLINIIPTDMFAQVRPQVLSIERSGLSVFRVGAFANIGQRLRILQLRNNILKHIDSTMFNDIENLEVLDLSGNKLLEIAKDQFSVLKNLHTLIISDNQISTIADGAFEALENLKILNLANNKIRKITKDTFANLISLESLDLENNDIIDIDWNAFAHIKNLKILNLGNNHLSKVDIRGLRSLEKLFLNNNSLLSLRNVSLRTLPNLRVLNLDRNSIKQISDGDFHTLGESLRLESVSLVSNEIENVEVRAFKPVHHLTKLSLQDNRLESLGEGKGVGRISFLEPLQKLTDLYLSNNHLSQIEHNDLSSLRSLQTLALDQNEIEQIHTRAFSNLPLRRLYLDHNRLQIVDKELFQILPLKIEILDISGNPWQCICGDEWLGDFVSDLGDEVSNGNMGCISSKVCVNRITEEEEHGDWITVIACILAFATLCMLAIIAMMCSEWNHKLSKAVSSDRLRLISDSDSSISLPYDVGIEPLISIESIGKPSLMSSLRAQKLNQPIIMDNGLSNAGTEKKRVRFNGL